MSDRSRPLRVGVISANWGGMVHVPAWRSLDGVEVRAICTSRRETAAKAARDLQIDRSFWDFRKMCADPDLDVIDVGTNPKLRQDMVAAALAGGKHVVNQMPFAMDAAAGQKMLDQARAAQRVGVVAASVVGLPHLRMMKRMIEDGALGEVFQVHCHWQLGYFNPVLPNFSYVWFGEPGRGVSVTRNQGSHILHALFELFGPITGVMGETRTFTPRWEIAPGEFKDNRTDDTMSALLRFESGAIGTVSTSWVASDSPGFWIEAFGRDGYLKLTSKSYPNPETAHLYYGKPNTEIVPTAQEVTIPEAFFEVDGRRVSTEGMSQILSMARIFESARAAIHGGPPPLASFERAQDVQCVIEAIYDSQKEGGWVAPRRAQSRAHTAR